MCGRGSVPKVGDWYAPVRTPISLPADAKPDGKASESPRDWIDPRRGPCPLRCQYTAECVGIIYANLIKGESCKVHDQQHIATVQMDRAL